MKYTKVRTRKYFAPQNDGREHICDYPGCQEKGEYKAPKDKKLKDYYWFCLKHVQEYNARWDFYADGDTPEDAKTKARMHFGGFRSRIKYQFGYDFIDELGAGGPFSFQNSEQNVYFNAKEREQAALLELNPEEITAESLKKQYKKLVKKYHPDVNAGDKACEEKFKLITAAYKELTAKINVRSKKA